jgi:hypothetical protein
MNDEFGKIQMEAAMACFKITSWHLLGGTQEHCASQFVWPIPGLPRLASSRFMLLCLGECRNITLK